MTLEQAWETTRELFQQIPIEKFDALVKTGVFSEGPLEEVPGQRLKEHGPYCPTRWVFGRMKSDELVCAEK